jgi:hypothetical protein
MMMIKGEQRSLQGFEARPLSLSLSLCLVLSGLCLIDVQIDSPIYLLMRKA